MATCKRCNETNLEWRTSKKGRYVLWGSTGEPHFVSCLATEQGRKRVDSVVASRATDAQIDIPAPEGLTYLPFQKAGIQFASARKNTLIGDEMGLGKGIETLGFLNANPTLKKILIVVPAGLKLNWQRELTKWLVHPLSIGIANGKDFPTTDIVIASYSIMSKHKEILRSTRWDLLVADEAHNLRNSRTIRAKQVFGDWDKDKKKYVLDPLVARRTLFLTGTALVNKPIELWPLVNYLDKNTFGNFWSYTKTFCDAVQDTYGWDMSGASNLEELQRKLRGSVMIRRLKKDVLKELPPKRHQVIVLPPDGNVAAIKAERQAIATLAEKYDISIEDLHKGKAIKFTEMAGIRHATAVAKAPAVVEHVKGVLESEDKVVVFVHHHDVCDIIQDAFADCCVVRTGETGMKAGQEAVDQFQGNPNIKVFIASIQASIGVNLTAASVGIFAEQDWVPGIMAQASDRLHRIGQQNSVLLQYLVLDGTIDVTMTERLVEKQAILDAAMDNEIPELEKGEVKVTPIAKEDMLLSKQVDAVHRGLKLLSGMCDGAMEEDGCGFNRLDTRFGKSLAGQQSLSVRQALVGQKMILKYKRQLPGDLYDVIKGERA